MKKLAFIWFFSIVIFLFLFSFSVQAYTETHYVCTNGNGAGSQDGSSWANCWDGFDAITWDVDVADDGNVGPDDAVYFRDDDGRYYQTLSIGASGLSGQVITFLADTGESPVFHGGREMVGDTWTNYTGNIYYADNVLSVDPYGMILDSTPYAEAANKDSVNATNRWFWDGTGTDIYIYCVGACSSYYTSIEAMRVRARVIDATADRDYLQFTGLEFRGGRAQVDLGTSDNVRFDNCNFLYADTWALLVDPGATYIEVYDSELAYTWGQDAAGGSGIIVNWNGCDNCTLSRSKVHDSKGGYLVEIYNDSDNNLVDENELYNGFATAVSVETNADNNTIQYNYIHDIGDGNGWWGSSHGSDTWGINFYGVASTADGNKALYNIVANTGRDGIVMETATNSVVYGNTVYDCCSDPDNTDDAGITVRANSDNNTIKNNISFTNADNYPAKWEDAASTGNVFDYNLYSPVTSQQWICKGQTHSTFAAWQADTDCGSPDGNGLNPASPNVTNAAGGDFTLASNSVAIDAGENLTATYDDGLDPSSSWPSSVTQLDQDLHGKPNTPTQNTPADEATGVSVNPTLTSNAYGNATDWDIGAYVREGDTHTASEWEIDDDGGDFSTPVYDSGEDAANLLSIATAAGLSNSTAYDWRVRHKNEHGWSSWATKFDFTTEAAAGPTASPGMMVVGGLGII